jgi:dipeptidyl aminopeptidase/acylaminoacyl peptidase
MKSDEYLNALLSLPGMYRPRVSRDGRWVAWTWARMGPAADVFAAPTDGSRPPIRLTETAEDTYLVSWLPDGSGVIVAQDKGGNERDQLFQVAIAKPMSMQPLTEPDPDYFIRGGQLHPNGHFLVYGANFDTATGAEIEPTWIYRHDLRSGERKALAKPEKGGYIVPVLSSDGNLILYPRMDRHPAGEQIWLVDIEGQEDREILNFGDDVKAYASWLPGEDRILVLAETATHRKLGVLDLSDEQLEWLVDDPQRNIEHAYVPYGSDKIVVVEVRGARTHASLLDPLAGDETSLSPEAGNLIPLAPYSEDIWIGQFYSSSQPSDICRFSILEPRPDRAASISGVWDQTSLAPDDFAPAEDFHWTGVDGLDIQGWLYHPDTERKGTIVYVHGGPTSHSQDSINNQIQLFVRNGFVVLDPNYRGSTGFGMQFREAIKKDGWGGMEQEDIRSGIEALIKSGAAKARKVGITGTSYGGYSSWCAITRFPIETVAAAAPICGMTDLIVDYETTRPDLRPYSEEMMGGSPSAVPDKYHDRSPINFVADIRGDLLIVQGERDPNVTPENIRVVREALEKAGIAYEMLVFADEGHGISKPKNQKVLYLRLLDFFGRALGSSE